jgi:AcrR family transcriptional regulator
MTEEGRSAGKRDRLARFYRVLAVLDAHRETGVHVEEVARRVGMSKRTVYRDLVALESEMAVPLWNDGHGTWGIAADALLPPLKLTLLEAMAVVISARLMARYADKYDPDLAAAFQKLEEGLPPALAAPVERALSFLATRPRDERFSRHVHQLTRAWAERRVVTFTYAPARYADAERAPRLARVRPYLIEPSLQTHALYLIGYHRDESCFVTAEPLGPGADPYPAMHGEPDSARLDKLVGDSVNYFRMREEELRTIVSSSARQA